MLQLTYDRFLPICQPDHFIVVTVADYRNLVAEQLPEVPWGNILCEPFKRNTAAAISFAAQYIGSIEPDATMVVTPSDHLILNPEAFVATVDSAVAYAQGNHDIVTIGVKASRPETAYGYIQVGDSVDDASPEVHKVKTFTEKPNADMAQVFFDCGDFCWNSGVFVWRRDVIVKAMREHMPAVQSAFDMLPLNSHGDWTDDAIRAVYEQCETISVDYAVLEKARNVVVCLTSALWSDIGGWGALYEQRQKDQEGNAVVGGEALLKGSSGCLVRVDDGCVCVVDGLKDYMVVQSEGVVLVCPRERGAAVWHYLSEIKADKE
ncbi:mannose-1-phosphate guanylyltransferase, partial [Salmonella enterica]|nr:mannose-1-phosphate guanylyltransferase [Salmonella enterica]